MEPAREWSLFVAGTFALMGGSLIAGAGRRAADAVVWENERRRLAGVQAVNCNGPFLRAQIRLNRGIGAALIAGAALLGAGLFGRLQAWRPSGAGALACGAALVVLSAASVAAHFVGTRPVPRFVEDAAPPSPLRERAADVLAWTLRAWWLAYGARLLWGLRG